MGLSITGITLMQIHWMRKTIRLNEENFDRTVNEALNTVVSRLEKEKDFKFSVPSPLYWNEVTAYSYTDTPKVNPHRQHNRSTTTSYTISHTDNFSFENFDKQKEFEEKRDEFYDSLQESARDLALQDLELKNDSLLSLFDSLNKIKPFSVIKEPIHIDLVLDSNEPGNKTMKVVKNDSVTKVIVISDDHIDTLNYSDFPNVIMTPPPPPPTISKNALLVQKELSRSHIWRTFKNNESIKSDIEKKLKHNQDVVVVNSKKIAEQEKKQQLALKQIIYEMDARKLNLKDRVNVDELKNSIGLELKNKGIDSPYEFALVSKDSSKKEVFATPLFNKISERSMFSIKLFPNNFVPLNDFLLVKFPEKDSAIYKSVILPISASLFFTLIVFLTFTITLVTIIKQKKLAEMKADFINNMTHELKTPIATISLASDSIENPKVVDKPESVKYFTSIIREENSRMNKLVESVLQTARLERKTLKLNLKEVGISKLIEKVADQMAIQADSKGGSILYQKTVGEVTMVADENLMENVIFNLIDNAIKYSSTPKVFVTLKKLPGGISVSVQDNGIGMNRSEQQRVFEKFYRVSQGDVHNIKGFGLGLSNVKEITELHGGIVQLRSELGKGSTFTLFFPNKQNGYEQRG